MKNSLNKIKNKTDGRIANFEKSSQQQETSKCSNLFYDDLLKNLRIKVTTSQLKACKIATSDVASIWLSSLPLRDKRFSSIKREFFDLVLLRYARQIKRLLHECVCKAKHNIDHVLTCKTGGFVALCDNEIVNITPDMLSMICRDERKN